jgi:hypothetical protein
MSISFRKVFKICSRRYTEYALNGKERSFVELNEVNEAADAHPFNISRVSLKPGISE